MMLHDYRAAIANYIRAEALPVDKYSHQPRLYRTALLVAQGLSYDDDVLYAAAWMHDLGVFLGHRPADLEALARWDNVAYVVAEVPAVLERLGFPPDKIPAVIEAIRTHLPSGEPTTLEATILRDADLLEQLGAVGVLRAVCKVGRDTRYPLFSDALAVLRRAAHDLPNLLRLPSARELARPRVLLMEQFLAAAALEAGDAPL